ncbi:MAG: hypothetical protein M1838_005051 [Thelocarpon superellum]|nr:MAG: hypothetical protein M1838_005051 [Thelocarpon superellum]
MERPTVLTALCLLASIPSASAWVNLSPSEHETMLRVLEAHGILMGIAFALLYPLGAITLRLLRVRGVLWIHAGIQMLAYAMSLVAFGMGCWLCWLFHDWRDPHYVIGIIVVGLITLQPVTGWIHHALYVKYRQRTKWAVGHVWLGRLVLVTGAINGGLAFRTDHNAIAGEVAYSVVAGVMFLIYFVVILSAHLRSRGQKEAKQGDTVQVGPGEKTPEELHSGAFQAKAFDGAMESPTGSRDGMIRSDGSSV